MPFLVASGRWIAAACEVEAPVDLGDLTTTPGTHSVPHMRNLQFLTIGAALLVAGLATRAAAATWTCTTSPTRTCNVTYPTVRGLTKVKVTNPPTTTMTVAVKKDGTTVLNFTAPPTGPSEIDCSGCDGAAICIDAHGCVGGANSLVCSYKDANGETEYVHFDCDDYS